MLDSFQTWTLVVIACAVAVNVAARVRRGRTSHGDTGNVRRTGLLDPRWKPAFILATHTFLLAYLWWTILRDMDRPSMIPPDASTWHRYTIRSLGMLFHGSIVALVAVAWWRAAVNTQISHRLNRLVARFGAQAPR